MQTTIPYKTTNPDRVDRLITILTGLLNEDENDTFDMHTWVTTGFPDTTACGTAACLGGWLALDAAAQGRIEYDPRHGSVIAINPNTDNTTEISEWAKDELGLDNDAIFYMNYWPQATRLTYNGLTDATRDMRRSEYRARAAISLLQALKAGHLTRTVNTDDDGYVWTGTLNNIMDTNQEGI